MDMSRLAWRDAKFNDVEISRRIDKTLTQRRTTRRSVETAIEAQGAYCSSTLHSAADALEQACRVRDESQAERSGYDASCGEPTAGDHFSTRLPQATRLVHDGHHDNIKHVFNP
jgi:hypothetical protein